MGLSIDVNPVYSDLEPPAYHRLLAFSTGGCDVCAKGSCVQTKIQNLYKLVAVAVPAQGRMDNLAPQPGIFIAFAQYTQRRAGPSTMKIVTAIALASAGIHAQAAVQPPAIPAEPDTLTASFWNEAIQNYWKAVPHMAISTAETAVAPDLHAKGIFADRLSAVSDAKYG